MLLFGLRAVMALATVLCLVPQVSAQELPHGTITLVVGNGAGGIADVTARMYAQALSRAPSWSRTDRRAEEPPPR